MTKEQGNREEMSGQEREGKGRGGNPGRDDLHRDEDTTRRDQNEQNEQTRGSGQQGDRKQEMGGGDEQSRSEQGEGQHDSGKQRSSR